MRTGFEKLTTNMLYFGLKGLTYTVKSHFKTLGLYIFIMGFWWAYKQGGLYPGGLIS